MSRFAMVLSVLFALAPLSAQSPKESEETDRLPLAEIFTELLGLTPSKVFETMGAPESVFSYRGNTPEEDNAVFFYDNYVYLFWFRNRVWQVRADNRWTGSLDGVRMGQTLSEVEALWGEPINKFDSDPTWTLPDRGYPARIRLYFEKGKLTDLYIYRSDW